ncbi:MAG: hypothetical protein U9Q20_04160 [Campylobacterota bacterium]|nr:hypothetical protein [Campylobacterota bacterium]
MHTVQLKLDDSIYENVMFLLNNLNLKGMRIEEKTNIDSLDSKNINDIDMFSNHSANLVEDWLDLSEDDVWK